MVVINKATTTQNPVSPAGSTHYENAPRFKRSKLDVRHPCRMERTSLRAGVSPTSARVPEDLGLVRPRLVENGTDPVVVQRMLRQSNVDTTMIYIHNAKKAREAQGQFMNRFMPSGVKSGVSKNDNGCNWTAAATD
jgi:hypothetical protein